VVVLGAGVLAACGSGSAAPLTALDRQCHTITAATGGFRILDPSIVTPAQIRTDAAAAVRIRNAADSLTSPRLRAATSRLATTVQAYVNALRTHQVEHATTLGGLLRQYTVPIAKACGLASTQLFAT
jgi:hypothetical protein